MAQIYKFFNSRSGDRKYSASDWADYFHTLVANGVGTETATELKASASGLRVCRSISWGYNLSIIITPVYSTKSNSKS